MPDVAPREVDLFGESVKYDVRRSDEADEPRIDIDIHAVVVVLPRDSETDPETLLTENAAWVLEKKRRYDSFRETIPDREFEAGASFPHFGEPHEIVIERRPASAVEEGAFKLARYHVAQTSVKRALETVYRREARETFEKRAEHYANEMGVEYERIELRNQRTRWGSCSTSGTLSLNWRLMMAPSEIIDYIVVHELAHLREANHNGTFWSLVAEFDPAYKAHSEWLDENSTQLIFSDEDI